MSEGESSGNGGYLRAIPETSFFLSRITAPALREIDIELTERCNNRCIHCYINRPEDDTDARAREMETGFVLDLLRQAADLGCLSVRFTGGEPLLRADFREIYIAARRLGMRVTIFTNARLITPELSDLFEKIPPGRPIEVSVYGMRPDSYDSTAGVRGAYHEYKNGVARLLHYGIPFMITGVFPENRHEFPVLEAWASSLPDMEKPGLLLNFELRARRDNPQKNRIIAKFRLAPSEIVAECSKDPNYLREMRQFCSKFLRPADDRLFSCGAGLKICVDSYGFAQMCLLLRHPDTTMNLRQTSLESVLSHHFVKFRELRGTDNEYLRRCAVCFIRGLCDQCPAKSWMEHGSLDTPVEHLCDTAHVTARYLGLIQENEFAWQVPDGEERIAKFISGGLECRNE